MSNKSTTLKAGIKAIKLPGPVKMPRSFAMFPQEFLAIRDFTAGVSMVTVVHKGDEGFLTEYGQIAYEDIWRGKVTVEMCESMIPHWPEKDTSMVMDLLYDHLPNPRRDNKGRFLKKWSAA